MKEAILYLEDGTSFRGRTLGTTGETAGEVVFNTSMTGYQEILTDPSYTGQIVVMTYPLIGRSGVKEDDVESKGVHVKGLIVKEFCRRYFNSRAKQSLNDYLDKHRILAMEGIDTRKLTRHLRERGVMKGLLSTEDFNPRSLGEKLSKVPSLSGSDCVKEVSAPEKYVCPVDASSGVPGYRVAALDCGIKLNILRILAGLGCEVHVVPARATYEQIWLSIRTAFFFPTGPGIRRPWIMGSGSCVNLSVSCRSSAAALGTRSWGWHPGRA